MNSVISKSLVYSDKSNIIASYGRGAHITDYAILLGGFVESELRNCEDLKNRCGIYWTDEIIKDENKIIETKGCIVDKTPYPKKVSATFRIAGVRPIIPASTITTSEEKEGKNGIVEVKYGRYPQTIVPEDLSYQLELRYQDETIRKTGKKYTSDKTFYKKTEEMFKDRVSFEYEYNGSYYIRFIGDDNCRSEKLSDGRVVGLYQPYWVKVEPITWLVDKEKDIAISREILFAGVQLDNNKFYKGTFKDSNLGKFIDNCFLKEINQAELTNRKLGSVYNQIKHLDPEYKAKQKVYKRY